MSRQDLSGRVYEGADVIDSRDVIERIAELKEARPTTLPDRPTNDDEWGDWTEDDEDELNKLLALESEAEGSPDWPHGEALIADHYFKEYAQELAEDIGAINKDATWPNTYIDWDAAADALKMDYTSVEYGSTTYWIRS